MGQIAAVYCRVSTHDQNCDRQERDLLAYADRCGYEIHSIHKETGSGTRNDRKVRSDVVEIARARSVNIILVSELTRWGRSTPDLISSLNDLHSEGVSLIAQSGFQFDLATPHGKLIAGVMASMAEFERDLLVERVRSGLANAQARGQKLGRPCGGREADLTNQAINLLKTGKSIRAVGMELKLSKSAVGRIMASRKDLPEGMDW